MDTNHIKTNQFKNKLMMTITTMNNLETVMKVVAITMDSHKSKVRIKY